MRKITNAVLAAMLCLGLLAAVASAGQDPDIVSIKRAGPIVRGETTFAEVKSWFGQPDRKDRHGYQCIRVIDAVWRGKFKILFDTFDRSMIVAIVRDNNAVSGKHGEIEFETRKGLRVGDRARKLHSLYPNADRHEHRGFNHHILRSSGSGRLEATTEDRRVTELRTFPYEAC